MSSLAAPATPSLRPVTAADRDRLLAWANDPEARAASFRTEPISAEAHDLWFAASLASESRHLWIVEVEGAPAGVVRLDRDGGEEGAGVVSINLAPEQRGRGLAAPTLRALAGAARALGFARLIAWVRVSNEASARAFRGAGYALEAEHEVEGVPALRFILDPSRAPRESG